MEKKLKNEFLLFKLKILGETWLKIKNLSYTNMIFVFNEVVAAQSIYMWSVAYVTNNLKIRKNVFCINSKVLPWDITSSSFLPELTWI